MVDIHLGKKTLRLRFIDIFTIIMLAIIYTLVAVVREGTPLYSAIENISIWFREFGTNSTQYLLIAFLISIIGNSSVMIIIPYVLVIYTLAVENPTEWVWIGLLSGLGAALGEFISYYIGRLIGSAKKVRESEVGEKFHRMREQFERNPKVVPLIVFIFAASPLPDDMILVPMGLMKYPYYKTFLPCVIGKTILTGITCFLGYVVGSIDPNFFEDVVNYYWWGPIVYLFKPSPTVNPQSDLISFSSVFIFIWIFLSINFDKMMMRGSKERKEFEKMLINGGIFTFDEFIDKFHILNHEKFKEFMDELVEKLDPLTQKDHKYKIEPVISKKEAYKLSFEFVQYFFSTEGLK
ncbi:VTT domain-containing protein [Candidatus Harpocratesius sp.]